MTIVELYVFLQPLIQVVGTICLIGLVSGGIIFSIAWVIRKLWMYILAFGAAAFALAAAALVIGAL